MHFQDYNFRQATQLPVKTSVRQSVKQKILQQYYAGMKNLVQRLGVALLLCGLWQTVYAQQPVGFSNLRTRVLPANIPFQILDSLTVTPPLVSATDANNGQNLDLQFFSLQNNLLYIDTANIRAIYPACALVRVNYRVLPFNLGASVSRLDTAAIRRAVRNDAIEFDYTPYAPSTQPWETSGLTSNGAYTRGISFGNSQNLVFNSNLNLQLNGRLGNDLEIQAALSDNSIPLQPDGTTRQLQEFDRIFIQLKRKNTTLTAGDFDLTRPVGYFSNYFKRLQGAMVDIRGIKPALKKPVVTAGTPINSAALLAPAGGTIRFAAAISRGKFARQTIAGQEGNQGPYRLQGAEGERFIIVLAGTEKVYIDGQLLRRGLQDDYVMDYNLGEIAFTSRRLITKDSRVIVEFEYAVQTYMRATIAANALWELRRSKFYFNYYAEQDSRNSGGGQDLSPAERRRLAEVGDNLRNAYASGIDTLASFDPARVLYSAVDTVICGTPISILSYSTNAELARYAVRFTEVPAGQGHYVLAQTAANGRVFRWTGVDSMTCQPTGNFEPIVRLVAPELRQLYAAGADFQPFKGAQFQAEVALSNRDVNRFSPVGNGDDYGGAGFLAYKQLIPFAKKSGWKAQTNINYEYTARTFQPLNPYRPAEFTRDWNTNGTMDTVTEQLARGGLLVEKEKWGTGRYEFGLFRRTAVYDGKRHFGQLRLQRNGFELFTEVNLLQTAGRVESTRFSRPKFDLSKTFGRKNRLPVKPDTLTKTDLPVRIGYKLGFYAERERNERHIAQADTLNAASFWYDLYRIYLETPQNEARWQFGGFLSQRNDFFPVGQFFKQNTRANELNVRGGWRSNPLTLTSTQTFTTNFTYRTLSILAPELTKQAAQNTYLGRADYTLSMWKNALNFTSGYELGSGQSPKVEFNYLAVNPGEGAYTWIDRNRDSILQIDEMEIAVFQDQANYVRVAVSTTEYVRTNNVLLNQNLRLDPRLVWATARRGWRRTLSRFSTQSTLQINRRTYANASGISFWNPFELSVADTALVTVQASVRNVLFVNRANPAWDASIAQGDSRSQVALTTGFERRRNADYTLHGRLNLGSAWSAETDIIQGLKTSDNEAFVSREYAIKSWEAGPKITWLPSRMFRLVGKFDYKNSLNTRAGAEKATQTDWNMEITWNPQSRANNEGFRAATSLRAKASFVNIQYAGTANSAVAFAMLDGLQNGRNFLWSLTLDRQLSKSMQMNLTYEGRKTGENRVIQVGRAQVRAIF